MSRLFQVLWIGTLIAFALVIGATGMSYSGLSRGNAPMADQLFFARGEANGKLADAYARAQEFDEAERHSRLALNRTLADVRAVRSIALAAEQRGDTAEFQAMLSAAGKLSWRDTPAQAKLFEQRLIAEDYLSAIDHADALMRKRDATEQLIEVFIIASLDDTLIGPIADKLAAQPTWRASFFANAKLPNAAYVRSFKGLVSELNKRGEDAAITRDELAPVVYLLNRSNRMSQGIDLWNSNFPEDNIVLKQGEEQVLPWKTARASDKDMPYDWFVPSNRRAYARATTTSAASSNLSLEIDPSTRSSGTIATKTVQMPAGTFAISIAAPDVSEDALERVFWTVKCDRKGDRTPLARVPGSQTQWRGSVGQCGAVSLELNLREVPRRDLERIVIDQVTVRAGQ